jgi:curli production assembly/transport component CsgF
MNNQRRLATLFLAFAGNFTGPSASASELVYTPVDPAFGGSPLNGSWLLSNAQAQNDFDDPKSKSSARSGYTPPSALQRFSDQLESRLLSQLLTDVGNGNSGNLTTDDFIVNIVDDSGNLTIQITDRLTGEISEISINGLDPSN